MWILGDWVISASVRAQWVNPWTLEWMLSQCKRLTLFAQLTLGCWRMTVVFFQHKRATLAFRSLWLMDAALTRMSIFFCCWQGLIGLADLAVKVFEFPVVAGYVPNIAAEKRSFFRRLGPFLDELKRLILVDDWNAFLEPKIYYAWWRASGSDKCESSLIDLLAVHDLVDRFYLDHPGR